jgi:hypothetical protein
MGGAPSPGARPPVSASQLADLAREYLLTHHGRLGRPTVVEVHFDAHLELVRVAISLPPLPPPPDPAEEPHAALLDIVALLARSGRRLTTTQILEGLGRQGTPHGESTVRKVLAAAVDAGRLTNDPADNPRGYGLPSAPG